jgi:hypothetical protein
VLLSWLCGSSGNSSSSRSRSSQVSKLNQQTVEAQRHPKYVVMLRCVVLWG